MEATLVRPRRRPAGTSSPYHLLIRGQVVVVGKEPDGDSVRFNADDPDLWFSLRNGHRVEPSKQDGSVQLRLEGIDTPELHYGNDAQPFGAEARTALLEEIGFTDVQYEEGRPARVSAATPTTVPGAVLSKAAEFHGRPVAFLLVGDAVPDGPDGTWMELTEDLLRQTLNFRQLEGGFAYPMLYTSTPLRDVFRATAAQARSQAAPPNVWTLDSSSEFVLSDQSSIGPEGALILPKLFRRATDYLRAVDKGYAGNLDEWLIWVSTPQRDENDGVVIDERIEVKLSDLIEQRNRTIRFQPDLLEITFVEKS
jgi:hypothetical protein